MRISVRHSASKADVARAKHVLCLTCHQLNTHSPSKVKVGPSGQTQIYNIQAMSRLGAEDRKRYYVRGIG
jgi:cytochrome c553